jgi:hypothetical protein
LFIHYDLPLSPQIQQQHFRFVARVSLDLLQLLMMTVLFPRSALWV